MKKLLTLLLIGFFTVYAGNVFAEPVPVKVFSSYFSIGGGIFGSYGMYNESSYFYVYGESGSIPLSDGVRYFPPNDIWGGWASADSSAGYFYVAVTASAGGEGFAGTAAEAEWIFQPLSPMDHLTIYGEHFNTSLYCSSSAELIDLTDTTKIWSKTSDWGFDLIQHSFQTNHVYRLYFQVAANANADSWNPSIYADGMTAVIPEPATLILLGLGLMGLAGFRRMRGQ